MIDEVEQALVGPVEILEDEDEWPRLGHELEEPAPRRKGFAAPVGAAELARGIPANERA